MDPRVAQYLAEKYQLQMAPEEETALAGSEARANSLGLGQGLMEAADTIAAGMSQRQKNGPLLAGDPRQSSNAVREYIMGKMKDRQRANAIEIESKMEQERQKREDDRYNERLQREDARNKIEDARNNRRDALAEQKMRQDQIAKNQSEKEAKNLKPTDIAAVSEGQDAMNLLSNLESKMKGQMGNMGPVVGRLKSWNEYDTEAQVLQSDVKAAAQMIGKYLEGGVLRAEDVPKYEAMLPTMKDKPEVAQGKIENVRKLLQMKQESRLGALEAQGYSVAGLKNQAPMMPIADSSSPKSSGGLVPEAIAADGKVKIMSPDGEVRLVDRASVKKYIDKGGKVIP